MSDTATAPTTREKRTLFESVAQAYFTALSDGNLRPVPWAPDVVLRAPLAERNPLTGRAQVEEYLQPLAGNLGDVQIREIFISTSRDAMAVEANVGPLHVLDKFVIKDGQIVEQQNFYDPRPVLNAPAPGGLTTEERALLCERLEGSRERLGELLNGLSDEQLKRRPLDGGWTALECAEHLVLSEELLTHIVRDQVLSGAPNPSLQLQLQGRDGAIVAAMNDRSQMPKTFDALIPRGKYPGAEFVLNAFLARRAATLDFVRTSTAPMHHHAAPLGNLGLLDAYHWLLLIAAHTDRHIEQMRNATACHA
jgi:hypothetical protein